MNRYLRVFAPAAALMAMVGGDRVSGSNTAMLNTAACEKAMRADFEQGNGLGLTRADGNAASGDLLPAGRYWYRKHPRV